jgi:hypothetical protein
MKDPRITGIVNRFFVTNDRHYRAGVNIACCQDAETKLRQYYREVNKIGPKDELRCAALDLVDWAGLVRFFDPAVESNRSN